MSTVDPNVKERDLLDIRPYVKIKLIPGGHRDESRYVDGIVFRKNVTHKNMPRLDICRVEDGSCLRFILGKGKSNVYVQYSYIEYDWSEYYNGFIHT